MEKQPPSPRTAVAPAGVRSAHARVRPVRALITVGIAVVTGLLVWVVAVPLAGVDLTPSATGRAVGPVSVLAAALFGGAAAWLLLVLGQRLPRGRARWTSLAVLVLMVSLAGPLLAGASGPALLVLELLHVTVGGVLIIGLRRSTAPGDTAGRTVAPEAS